MDLRLFPPPVSDTKFEVAITGSKSESNRLLILQALFPMLEIENLSNSDDTQVLKAGLTSSKDVIDIHHAGTAMRFLTAYLASKPGVSVLLTGSERMQQRPIGILVDALRSMGADIEYDQQTGYPPLRIKGKALTAEQVSISAQTSSQYLSALMLIAPSLPAGLTMKLKGAILI